MSQNRKEDITGKLQDAKGKESPAKSNPFDAYRTINHPSEDKPTLNQKSKENSRSSKSPKSPLNQSRSRSQEHRSPNYREDSQIENFSKPQSRNQDRHRQRQPKPEPAHTEQAYFKTKMCPLYEKGACKKGSACNFAHGQGQLRGLPNFRKTRLCIPFKTGQCSKPSHQCKYAHGQGQLRKLAYDYFPQKSSLPPRSDRNQRNDRDRSRRRREDEYRDQRPQKGYKDHRERDYDDRSRDHKDRHREQRRDSRDRNRDRDKDRERERERQTYNRDYHIQPNYGYMSSGYNNAYMMPGMGGYGPSDYYPAPSSFSGYGSGMGSSFGGSGTGTSSQGSSYPNGSNYTYGYGFMPNGYSSYNPSSSV